MIYNIDGTFDVETIQHQVLSKHHHFINHEWKGPDFKHLRTKAKNGKFLDVLTIVYDKRGYKKRCNNSQEDWFRKFDGEFLACCIHEVEQVLYSLFLFSSLFYLIPVHFLFLIGII